MPALPTWAVSAIEAAFGDCTAQGIAPGDIAQKVLELVHAADAMPCGEGEAADKARVTRIEEATGSIEQWVMGPDADYVLTVGPGFELAHVNRFAGGTTQLTIKRKPTGRSAGEGED